MGEMEPEVFFLRYAFPCSFLLRQHREISEQEFSQLEQAAIAGEALPRALLEKVYFRAFQKIEKFAEERGKDKWNLELLKEYFLKRHNKQIDQGMYSYKKAPEKLRELCKVQKARVVRVEKEAAVVEWPGGRRPVLKQLVPDIKVGDTVTIHYGYAIERVNT